MSCVKQTANSLRKVISKKTNRQKNKSTKKYKTQPKGVHTKRSRSEVKRNKSNSAKRDLTSKYLKAKQSI